MYFMIGILCGIVSSQIAARRGWSLPATLALSTAVYTVVFVGLLLLGVR